MSTRNIKAGHEAGGSMVEFAVSVSVLLFLIFGVVETGRLITQFAWVSQTLYEITLTGSENLTSVGVQRMGDKSQQFAQQLNENLSAFSLDANYEIQSFVDSTSTPRNVNMVVTRVSGDLIPFIEVFDYDISLGYSAIHAATARPLDASLQNFGLLDDQQYQCDTVTKCYDGSCPPVNTPCCNFPPCLVGP